jgi:HlyD family secretion protein
MFYNIFNHPGNDAFCFFNGKFVRNSRPKLGQHDHLLHKLNKWNIGRLAKIAVCACLGGVFFLGACERKSEKIQPVMEKITESVYASGIVKSKNQYLVFPTVSGLIHKIWVREGGFVLAGDPLFSIENENSQTQAENAQLAADFANFNTRGERLEELKNAIQTAQIKKINDSLLLQRQRDLWAQQIDSKVALEQRELAYLNSLTNYEAAKLRYQELKKQLAFAAAQTQKVLAISQKNAADFTVRSKIKGRVYSVAKEEGEIVSSQTPLAVVGDAYEFLVQLQIDENDIVRIKTGQRVLLILDSYQKQVFEASISKIDPIMNERTRTFTVEAIFIQNPPILFPNLTVEANIFIFEKENALTIPRSFLMDDSLVIMANKEKRRVIIGLKDYQKVEILQGLKMNETLLKPE